MEIVIEQGLLVVRVVRECRVHVDQYDVLSLAKARRHQIGHCRVVGLDGVVRTVRPRWHHLREDHEDVRIPHENRVEQLAQRFGASERLLLPLMSFVPIINVMMLGLLIRNAGADELRDAVVAFDCVTAVALVILRKIDAVDRGHAVATGGADEGDVAIRGKREVE